MLRQLRVAEDMDKWDGFDSALVTPDFFFKKREISTVSKFDEI